MAIMLNCNLDEAEIKAAIEAHLVGKGYLVPNGIASITIIRSIAKPGQEGGETYSALIQGVTGRGPASPVWD